MGLDRQATPVPRGRPFPKPGLTSQMAQLPLTDPGPKGLLQLALANQLQGLPGQA